MSCHDVCRDCAKKVQGEEKSIGRLAGPDLPCVFCGVLCKYNETVHMDGDTEALRRGWLEKCTRTKVEEDLASALSEREGTFALYVNADFASNLLGKQVALMVGPSCTYPYPPAHLADTIHFGPGWRYQFAGLVNRETWEACR